MPEINLEDFERKLRAAGSGQGGVEDPLEELTRLVNTIANDRPRDERVVDFTASRAPARPATPPAPLLQHDDEPEFAPPPEVYAAPRRSLPAAREDAPPLEAPLLRPTFAEEPEQIPDEAPLVAVQDDEDAAEAEPAAAPTRKRSWYLKVGGLTALAVLMIAGAATLKFGATGVGSKTPPMILAASGPNKVAPPDETTVQSPQDTGALLNKDSTTTGSVKVVANQEQPVDMALKGDSPVAPMKDSPIIAPNQAPMVVPAAVNTPAPPAAAPAASQPRGPKTVSVRPDGTLIVAGAAPTYAPAAAASTPLPAARKPDPAPSVITQAASPTLELPPAKAPKSSQRVAVGKTDTTAPTDPVNAPMQLGSAASEKPAKLPTKLSPPQRVADAAATDAAPAAPAPSSGEWAVQLAAPRSDADAQSAIQRLQTKFGSALGDTELGVKKAEVNGETIYRVRASGLSRADASALCSKLKADGGDCFVARN